MHRPRDEKFWVTALLTQGLAWVNYNLDLPNSSPVNMEHHLFYLCHKAILRNENSQKK